MASVDADILIIGAGIGGLALGAILRRLGVSFKVLERTETIQPVGAGISLAPNALKLLDDLGLYGEILSRGQKLKKIQIVRNRVLWNVLDWSLCETTFGYPVVSMERHEFHHILFDAAGGHDNVLLGAKVEEIVDEPNQPSVVLRLQDGRALSGRFVVGADGIRSVTRRILAGSAHDKSHNTIRFTGRIHMSGITAPLATLGKENLGVANWMLYDDSILTTWPCQDNRQWFIGVKSASSSANRDRSVWAGTSPEMIKDVYGDKYHPFAENGVFAQRVSDLEKPLAAHSMTSFFGQGACQAIEDAAVLGQLIQQRRNQSASMRREKHHDFGGYTEISRMLAEFSQQREGRVKELSAFSSNFALLHMAKLPYGLGPAIRRIVYGFFPAWVWMWYLSWLYGHQPTVSGLSAGHSAL
ncbi:FAD binding monooxygenase [Apiospora marii]|uniref:FAD binding monooxygenase n=1 Tax=Apiospora marii TaxID=335849 RepID=UPI00312E4490